MNQLDRLNALRAHVQQFRESREFRHHKRPSEEEILRAWDAGIATRDWAYDASAGKTTSFECIICNWITGSEKEMWEHIETGAHKDGEMLLRLSV